MEKKILIVIIILVCGIFLFANGQQEDNRKGPITVASKIDTEGALLGNMIIILLEENGFKVIDKTEFGPTDIVRKAIIAGEIDIYPEYTGNGNFFFPGSPSTVWKNRLEAYNYVKELDLQNNKLVWLAPAPANNTWAIAVRQDLADENNLVTLEDLGTYIREGGQFKLAGSEEFVSRADALPSFEDAYNFILTDEQLLILSGGNTATTEQAAARQTNGVNAAMAYGTDGQLAALGLVVMKDSFGVQPVYEPAPLIRESIYNMYPEIKDILEPVFQQLDLKTLQRLNSKIVVEGFNARSVAQEFLEGVE